LGGKRRLQVFLFSLFQSVIAGRPWNSLFVAHGLGVCPPYRRAACAAAWGLFAAMFFPQALRNFFSIITNDAPKTTALPWQQRLPSLLQESVTVASQALSLLSEKSASYFESLSSHLPSALQSLVRRAIGEPTTVPQPPPTLYSYLTVLLQNPATAYPATLVAVILVLVAMSYGNRQGWGGGRLPSPFSGFSGSRGAPQVTDRDFSYVTSDDLEYPARTYDPHDAYYLPRAQSVQVDDGPDILLLRHKSVTYPLQFPAYAINDGLLLIGDVRKQAAKQTGTKDPRRIKLLYKGRILKEDGVSARSEGLKQESEIMCVVSEGMPNGSGHGGSSDDEIEVDGSWKPKVERRPSTRRPRRPTTGDAPPTGNPNLVPPPMDRGPSSSGNSRANSPAPKTALGQLDQLASTFHTKLVPQCILFTSNPPKDTKTRDFEHKKLSEMILAQIILKLDEVTTGDDMQARQRRKDLVKEAQAMLATLDEAAKHG
jgi:hypothetical protein